jgi:hypothetical protein
MIAISILVAVAAGLTTGGLIYAFRNDTEREWAEWRS